MTDDEMDLELVDEPLPRPPRRWPQLVLLLAAVAVVIGVGLLDDGRDAATSLPTTTSTAPTTTGQTTTITAPPTTTTTLPRVEAGTGPVLPDATGSYLATIDTGGLVTVVDLATGQRCINRASRSSSWLPFNNAVPNGMALVQTEGGSVIVDASCAIHPLVAATDGGPVAATEDSFWILAADGSTVIERSPTRITDRSVELPPNAGATVIALGDRLVVGLAGTMTLVDPDTGRRRALGTGNPIAGHDRTLAYVACPALECSIVLLDVDTGARRTIGSSAFVPSAWGPAEFSSDGRLLATVDSLSRAAVVSVATGGVTEIDAEGVLGFTSRSEWLIARRGGSLIAVRPDGSDLHALTTRDAPYGTSLLLAPPDH